MKMSIFFSSFFSIHCSGSKPFTSPAKRVANADASKRVIGPMPLDAAAERIPVCLGADTNRRHQADAGHDDSPAQNPSVPPG